MNEPQALNDVVELTLRSAYGHLVEVLVHEDYEAAKELYDWIRA